MVPNQGPGERLGLCPECMGERIKAQRRVARRKYRQAHRDQLRQARRYYPSTYRRPPVVPLINPIGMTLHRVSGTNAGRVVRAKNPRYL